MKRKIIQIADSTQLVSLPRKWAVAHGLKKGDEVDIEEQKNSLQITLPNYQSEEKDLDIEIENSKKFLRRMLFSPYIQGYTEIRIKYHDAETFDLISQELELLMGYEIVEQGSNFCTIKRIATALDNDFDSILSRIFTSTISMMQEMSEALGNSEKSRLTQLKSLELTNNKLSYFCLRLLNNRGYKDEGKTNSIYYIILLIEQNVDVLRNICDYYSKKGSKIEKESLELFDQTIEAFQFVHRLFKNFDAKLLVDFNLQIKALNKSALKQIEQCASDVILCSYLQTIIDNISHISKEIHY